VVTHQTLKALADQTILKSVVACTLSAVAGGVMSGGNDFLKIVLTASVFGVVTAGFNSLNGIVDVEADKVSRPERPLPSGRLKTDQAWKFTICLFLSGLLLFAPLLALRMKTILPALSLVVIDYALAIFYSLPPKLKRMGLLANAIVGVHHTILPMLTEWSMFKPLREAPSLLFLALFFVAWSVHIIEDFEDVEGDRKAGTQTLPLLLGKRGATLTLTVICSFSILMGVLNSVYRYRPYWLICFPQQVLIILFSSKLTKAVELSQISKIHKICEVLSITTGLTLFIGYVLLG